MGECVYKKTVEKWGVFEVTVPGPVGGNPFLDYQLKGIFRGKNEEVEVDGFYDGDGLYKVRFMPSFVGDYSFKIYGNSRDQAFTGNFTVTPASGSNHGP